jgi:D-serine deaminase-like pyridoxal phosphate-dependent protein
MVRSRHPSTDDWMGRLRDDIGRPIEDISTPALVVDLPTARRNIETMASRVADLGTDLRPHIKVHKSAELARLQLDAGACGVTTATVAEAIAMAEVGIPDVLIANEVVEPGALARLAEAARSTRIRVAVDDAEVLAATGRAAVAAGSELGVLVDVDVGLGRAGARSPDEAVRLAVKTAETQGITFDGLMGYEGHCASEPDRAVRFAEAERSMARLAVVADACRDAGLDVTTISAGATGTFEPTGGAKDVTEVQAGSYALMDRFHALLIDGFEFALTVMATVISRHDDLLVLDAGRKAVDVSLRPLESPDPRATLAFIHEEHVGLRYRGSAPGAIGDRMRFVPGYAPTTVNLFGAYHVIEDGQVVDVWRVLARHGAP